MRHGKPTIDKPPRLNAAEFGVWVEAYKAAGIDASDPPPSAAIEQARQCALTVCSDLARSVESAAALGVKEISMRSPSFREMEMPYAVWRFPRLSASNWSIFFRLAWICGYSSNAEPFETAKARARDCAERLAELSASRGNVLFVGHGTLNWFVARHLGRIGWSASGRPPERYWEFSVFRPPSN